MVSSGYMSDLFTTGTVVLGLCIYNSTLKVNINTIYFKVMLFSNSYTLAVAFGLIGSIGVYKVTFGLIS